MSSIDAKRGIGMQCNGQSNKEKMINCGLKMNETNQRMQRLS
jgi:hypothetical protein